MVEVFGSVNRKPFGTNKTLILSRICIHFAALCNQLLSRNSEIIGKFLFLIPVFKNFLTSISVEIENQRSRFTYILQGICLRPPFKAIGRVEDGQLDDKGNDEAEQCFWR